MKLITQTLREFTTAVKKGESLSLTRSGFWRVDGFLRSLLYRLISCGTPLIVSVVDHFNLFLDKLEETPVRFGVSVQPVDFDGYLLAAEALLERIKLSNHSKALRSKIELERRIVALRYRLEGVNGGWDKEDVNPTEVLELSNFASAWKQNEDIFYQSKLTVHDYEKLVQVAEFRGFVSLLINNEQLRNSFFVYALRDCLKSDFFIQYPALQEKLLQSNMQGRIGRMGDDWLKIDKIKLSNTPQAFEKIVTLPFENRPLNILNPLATVHFRGNYILSISEIFNVFKSKNSHVGNLEFMSEGIVNWNVHHLGWWNADSCKYETIALHNRDWWKPLPLFEVISKEEAQARYGQHLNGTSWSAVATATRGTATLNYEQSHAYLELIVPTKSNSYAIYDFGKFATKFPTTFLESLAMFCHTVKATVAYPDENVYYTHRQHAQHSIPLNQKQGYQLLELIRLDLIKARAGNFVYQIESDNCAKWLHEMLESVVGKLYNLFTMKLLDTEPVGMVRWIFKGIRSLPKGFQVPILMLFHYLLGAYQKTWILENNRYVCKSLRTHNFWRTGEVFLPAFLHNQLQTGKISMVSIVNVLVRALRQKIRRFADLYGKSLSRIEPHGWDRIAKFMPDYGLIFRQRARSRAPYESG